MNKVLFVINSSKSLSITSITAMNLCLESDQLSCTKVYTSKAKDAIELSKKGSLEGANTIVAVGGDGTCNEVLNGILSSKLSNVVMGIIPNGTGNDFQKMLEEFEPERFVELLESQKSKKIDALRVNMGDKSHFALNIAGGGFDGYVVNLLNKQRVKMKIGGKISYALAILRAFFSYLRPVVEIESKEFTYKGECLLVAACNGSTFGHGLVIHPEAKLDSGTIGITLMGKVTLMDYVKYLSKLKKGHKIIHPEVHYFQTNQLKIKAPNELFFSQADGELLSDDSITIDVIPKSLNFLM